MDFANNMGDLATIDPGVVTLIQSTFLDHIKVAFATASNYAFNLLYLFAALELVMFGLIWALQRGLGFDKLFFKILKIGIIFFIIQNYSFLLETIIESFAQLSGIVVNHESLADYVFNPAKIWQYGYDSGVNLLKLAANSEIFGMAMIQILLGAGILFIFGLLGIQMIVQIISFYVISFGTLVLLPFGALNPSRRMFNKGVQAILQAGLRLMVLIMIIGIAIITWEKFDFTDLQTTSNFNINQPLGLFFTALLFLSLALYLPKIISQAVGELSSAFAEGGAAPSVTVTSPSVSVSATTSETATAASNMQAATAISPSSGGAGGGATSPVSSAAIVTTSTSAGAGGAINSRGETLSQASKISKSISDKTMKNIKKMVSQAAKEK